MRKKLQVLMGESELNAIKRLARRNKITVAEWVRKSLSEAGKREPALEASKKIEAVRYAYDHSFPVSDIEQMLSEVDKGNAIASPG